MARSPKLVRTVDEPAAGTGGMLTAAIDQLTELNPAAIVEVYGQDLNDETWSITRSDLMLQSVPPERMANGSSLTADAYRGNQFDYIPANPRTGWTGKAMRLQHMISKMKSNGSRLAIVLSGSPAL